MNCGKEGSWLCESCINSLFFMDARFCPFCGALSDIHAVCKKCEKEIGISAVFSLFKYNDSLVRKIIKNFKYRYIKDIGYELEPIFRKFIFKYKNLIDFEDAVLIPVPLYPRKEKERGFNQAELLANIISEILNISVNAKCVKKCKKTKNQAKLDTDERLKNLTGAFRLIGDAPKKAVIVDDVFTTGATVREITNILRSAGTEKIQIITFARG
ncbi:ComF family protein [Candidatus Parcubacteria bacterium]|nr:ComF family protein [Candidatus Parcubacteria bacterium]